MAILIIKRVICGLRGLGIYVSAIALLAIITIMHKRLIYLKGTSFT
jgi:hypothetical protein